MLMVTTVSPPMVLVQPLRIKNPKVPPQRPKALQLNLKVAQQKPKALQAVLLISPKAKQAVKLLPDTSVSIEYYDRVEIAGDC